MVNGNKKSEQSYEPCDLYPPTHQHQDSQMCVRKTFPASFLPQPAENNTPSQHTLPGVQLVGAQQKNGQTAGLDFRKKKLRWVENSKAC